MATDALREGSGTENWDRLYEMLSSQPRRMLVFSLMKEPEDGRLPLPDAAQSSVHPMDPDRLCVQLRHYHLPKLAEAGYVRWESDPFSVRRGPHFEEPAFVIDKIVNSDDEYPARLRDECVVIGDLVENDST